MSPQQAKANGERYPADESPSADISALSGDPGADSPPAAISPANGSIGPYQLLQRIGSGGMGEVWLAEQMHPVRRRVALKLIKAGMDTGEVVARFQSERQALALMDHPSIAKVFDAGSTPQGRPYFVMEYITGIPITQYCDQHRMTAARAPGAIRCSLRRRTACAPESDHPSRFEAIEHSGERSGWQAGAANHRLRRGQGHFAAV